MAANQYLLNELIDAGLDRREARWLIDEFSPVGDHETIEALRAATRRRLDGEPLQYIIGHWPFRSLDLDLDPRVLIPRPETEELVGVALDVLAASALVTPLIVDLGCGSGAIGLSLLFELRERGVHARVVCVDTSSDALDVARRNARKHNLESVTFVRSSWFDEVDPAQRGSFDLIVANPPYVAAAEFAVLDPILSYEPLVAIVAEDSARAPGFADLAHIIAVSPSWLSTGGTLVCEHGNMQRDAVLEAARESSFQRVADRDDIFGNPRILVATR